MFGVPPDTYTRRGGDCRETGIEAYNTDCRCGETQMIQLTLFAGLPKNRTHNVRSIQDTGLEAQSSLCGPFCVLHICLGERSRVKAKGSPRSRNPGSPHPKPLAALASKLGSWYDPLVVKAISH